MIDSILLFIQQNQQYAWGVIFLIAFLESMAIVGMLVPGWLLLVGVGTLIGTDKLTFYPIAISAYLGAVIGEYLSYWVGLKYHNRILKWHFVEKHKKLIRISQLFFKKHGALGVFIGRFFGPTRAVLPLAAGICEMRAIVFSWVNFTSGLIWAPLYLLPGILIGAAFSLEKEQSYQLLFVVGLLVIVGYFTFNSIKRTYQSSRQQEASTMTSVKSILWLLIFTVSLLIFIRSEQFDLLKQILAVLVSKL